MSSSPGSHSLAFRVMRLCRPSFHVDAPLRLDPLDLITAEDLFHSNDHHHPLTHNEADSADPSYRDRFVLRNPNDAMGLPGLLVLPQAFGAIYLGETFCSYISINNSSNSEARDVVIKVRGRYDFIVEHDVKELGAHTLVCTALYNDGDGERKYLPQFFKFVVANPLSVRTKVRSIKENTYLEACIENHTKSNLYMDQVEFEPLQPWSATILTADEHHSETKREIFKPPVLIKAGGGIQNYLYQLKLSSNESTQVKSNALGKLQITWRTNLGEPGRLQTQQILGSPITQKEIELRVVDIPAVIVLERPFSVRLNLSNQTDRKMGQLEVYLSPGDSYEERAVMVNGLQTLVLPQVEAFNSVDFNLNLIATRLGVQKISGIMVFDAREKRLYDPLPDIEIFVILD